MLSGAGNKIASRAFLDYLRSMESRKLIESFGYRTNDCGWLKQFCTLKLAGATTVVLLVVGTPLRGAGPVRRFRSAGALVAMPLVLPPTVLGLSLLMLGPEGPIGRMMEAMGDDASFTFAGLVVGSVVYSLPLSCNRYAAPFTPSATSPSSRWRLRASPLDTQHRHPLARPGLSRAPFWALPATVGNSASC